MSSREQAREIGAAVFAADGRRLMSVLGTGPWPDGASQLVGDGLLLALAQQVAGARDLAARCVAELRARDWEGDEELAAALAAGLGTGPAPLLRPLPVDLEQLADVLEGDPLTSGGRIDLHTGQVWPQTLFDYAEETEEDDELDDDERWLAVFSEGSRAGYRDMEHFIAAIAEPDLADRLRRSLEGRGPFRRFRDELRHWPDLESRWYAYSSERHRGRARAWLAAQGFTPTAPAELEET